MKRILIVFRLLILLGILKIFNFKSHLNNNIENDQIDNLDKEHFVIDFTFAKEKIHNFLSNDKNFNKFYRVKNIKDKILLEKKGILLIFLSINYIKFYFCINNYLIYH